MREKIGDVRTIPGSGTKCMKWLCFQAGDSSRGGREKRLQARFGSLGALRTRDETAAEDACIGTRRGIERAGLSGAMPSSPSSRSTRMPFSSATSTAGRGGRVERTLAKQAKPHLRGLVQRTVAQPVDVAQIDAVRFQRFLRADDDTARAGVEIDDIERLAGATPRPLRWPIV